MVFYRQPGQADHLRECPDGGAKDPSVRFGWFCPKTDEIFLPAGILGLKYIPM